MSRVKIPPRLQEWQQTGPDLNTESKISVFVSHAWRDCRHPDPDGEDWSVSQEYLWKAIAGLIDAVSVLICVGVPRATIEHRLRSCPESELTALKHPMGGLLTNGLFGDLAHCVLQEMRDQLSCLRCPDQTAISEGFRRDCCRRVGERIQIWFDFASLPQHPRSAEETAVFRSTLSRLADIQKRMHTLTVSPDSGYMERAWCVAEWLLGDSISTPTAFEGEDDLRSEVLPLGPRRVSLVLAAFRALMNPGILDSEGVLDSLGLRITNGKSDADVVCRILWESSRSATLKHEICNAEQETLALARGSLREVVNTFECLHSRGFEREPPVKSRRSWMTLSDASHVRVYWFVHEVLQGEDRGKKVARDLGGLRVVLAALSSCEEMRRSDVTVTAGFTRTTAVKLEEGSLLCGFSCDEALCDVADIVVPMRGSAISSRIHTQMQDYQRALSRWLENRSDHPEDDRSSISGVEGE